MCVEFSRDASVQLRIKSRPVVPSGVRLLEVLNILELTVTEIVLLDSGHLEQMEMEDTQRHEGSRGDNATKDETTSATEDCESRAFNLSCRIINHSAIATRKYMVPSNPGIPTLSYPAPTPNPKKRSSLKVWGCVALSTSEASPKCLPELVCISELKI